MILSYEVLQRGHTVILSCCAIVKWQAGGTKWGYLCIFRKPYQMLVVSSITHIMQAGSQVVVYDGSQLVLFYLGA